MKLLKINSNFFSALENHNVIAEVTDIDHHRSFSTLGLVDTCYVIEISSRHLPPSSSPSSNGKKEGCEFKTYRIGKSFKDLRVLVVDLKKAAKKAKKKTQFQQISHDYPESTMDLISLVESVSPLVEHEPTSSSFGKMKFSNVVELSNQRRKIINKILKIVLENYPQNDLEEVGPELYTNVVTDFFFTDYLFDGIPSFVQTSPMMEGNDQGFIKSGHTDSGGQRARPLRDHGDLQPYPILPMSSKYRLSETDRRKLEKGLSQSGNILTIHDEDMYNNPATNSVIGWFSHQFDNPFKVGLMFGIVVLLFVNIDGVHVTIPLDIGITFLLFVYMLGVRHSETLSSQSSTSTVTTAGTNVTDSAAGTTQTTNTNEPLSTTLLRKSLNGDAPARERTASNMSDSATFLLQDDNTGISSGLLPQFPKGGKIGKVNNVVSEPTPDRFQIRGPNYLTDKIKIPSGSFIFPSRGVNLFLSDICPEHIARYKAMMGGKLRDKPTFLVNFRLPWGVLVLHNEIPSKFLPFLRHRYYPDEKPPSTDGFSNEEVCVSRFLMGNDEHKHKTLKIVPSLVKGPWIVKKAVDGKPAIVGTKMPIRYYYQPADTNTGRAEYLEADLDIVGSSVARSILAVTQRYTNTLTLDLGFVVQGNATDELPERMLIGARLHGIDPVLAPELPDQLDD